MTGPLAGERGDAAGAGTGITEAGDPKLNALNGELTDELDEAAGAGAPKPNEKAGGALMRELRTSRHTA